MEQEIAKTRRYSFAAMALMVGFPLMMYLLSASYSIEMREGLLHGGNPTVADLAMGGSFFMARIGAIALGLMGGFIAFFGKPKDSAPKWMVRCC